MQYTVQSIDNMYSIVTSLFHYALPLHQHAGKPCSKWTLGASSGRSEAKNCSISSTLKPFCSGSPRHLIITLYPACLFFCGFAPHTHLHREAMRMSEVEASERRDKSAGGTHRTGVKILLHPFLVNDSEPY